VRQGGIRPGGRHPGMDGWMGVCVRVCACVCSGYGCVDVSECVCVNAYVLFVSHTHTHHRSHPPPQHTHTHPTPNPTIPPNTPTPNTPPPTKKQVFQRMEAAEKRLNSLRIPGFLSTHPAFPDRIASLQRKVKGARSVVGEYYVCVLFIVCV
jgi:hypothetical protein